MGHSPEIFFRRAGSLEDAELGSGRSDDCLLAKFLGLVPRYTTSSSSSSSSLSTRGTSRGRVPRYSISSLSLSITVSSSSTSKLESTTAPYGRRRLWNPDILARVKALWKILRSGSPGLLAFGYQWRISALINRVRRRKNFHPMWALLAAQDGGAPARCIGGDCLTVGFTWYWLGNQFLFVRWAWIVQR